MLELVSHQSGVRDGGMDWMRRCDCDIVVTPWVEGEEAESPVEAEAKFVYGARDTVGHGLQRGPWGIVIAKDESMGSELWLDCQ